MGKAIRFNHIRVLLLFLVISPLYVLTGFGQILITDTRSFEVSFSEEETQRMPAGIEISVHDPAISSYTNSESRMRRFTSSEESMEGSFYVESYGDISFGTYYQKAADNVFAQLPFRNATSASFNKLSIAFDFLFLPAQLETHHSFQLSYRINDGIWISPGGGKFSSEILQTGDEGWSSFTMQITLDQLYLRPNDKIELRWNSPDVADEDSFLPIALQKIEFYPTEAIPKQIRPGSLIITELLPRYNTGRGFIEYAEIYNSTEEPINLKGLILEAGFDAIVIQHDLYIAPYKTVVIANYEGINNFDNVADYKYSGTLLGALSGRLETRFEEYEVAKALFDASVPGAALQLDHLQNAYDGYSGMRYFTTARQLWENQFYGNPGKIDTNKKLFTRTISKPGWHVLAPPGRLSTTLNRELENMIETIITDVDADTDQPEAPYIFYHNGQEPVTFFSVTGDNEARDDDRKMKLVRSMGLSSMNFSQSEPVAVNRLVNQQEKLAFPALLSWNNENQNFELLWRQDDEITPWSAIFAPNVNPDYNPQLVKTAEGDSWTGLKRMIQLSLIKEEDSGRGASIADQALIGFWDTHSELENRRMDLPKIWSPVRERSDDQRSPFIYLKSADAGHQTNSFINYQYNPTEVIQVAVGVRLNQTNGRYRIEWDEIESLPEHWDIEFVDAELDEVINMRREHSYSFSERSDQITTGMREPDFNFQKVEQTEYNRFYVRLSSTGQLGRFERENESADSIELKQNYPNPFNPSTTVVFYLPNSSHVRLGVYNVVGQQVGVLVDDRLSAGEHSVNWNAMDMPSGVYIVQLEAGNTVNTRKITLIK